MNNEFRFVDKNVQVNIFEHCFSQKLQHSNLKTHIGCDSRLIGGKIFYITVVAFHYGKSGAHFVYRKDIHDVYRDAASKPDIFTKLWKEADYTISLAEALVQNQVFTPNEFVIEFDYNNLKEFYSNRLVQSAVGWATGLGFNKILTKSGDQIACKAADHICDKLSS